MRAYLDYAAGAPARPVALEAMLGWLEGRVGNPTGAHSAAREARSALESAREDLASVLGAAPGEVVLTGGGTEADNLAVLGAVAGRRRAGLPDGALVVSSIEHHAVSRAAAAAGLPVREVGVDCRGVVDLDQMADALDPGVALVSVMAVNNEIGVAQPVEEVAALARRLAPSAVVHTDAVQAMPWQDLGPLVSAVDLVTISGHKFGGPQGVGALVARDGVPLAPQLHGGGQERDRRAGTHNVAGVLGMASAAVAAAASREAEATAVAARRDRLESALLASLDGVTVSGAGAPRAPGFAHLCFEGVESEALILLLDEAGVCASAGASCASGATEPSHVLVAMRVPDRYRGGALRLSLGHGSTDRDVDAAIEAVHSVVRRLRARADARSGARLAGAS